MYNFEFKARRDSPKTVRIKRRFNDFVKLNEKLAQYFKSKKIGVKLPALPPKVAAFGSKTSPKSREGLLETYLNRLLLIESINRCLVFLDFLQPDNPEEGIVLYAPNA